MTNVRERHVRWLHDNIFDNIAPADFFDHFEYEWEDQKTAEQDLRLALEDITSWKDKMAVKAAQRMLSDIEVRFQSKPCKNYWARLKQEEQQVKHIQILTTQVREKHELIGKNDVQTISQSISDDALVSSGKRRQNEQSITSEASKRSRKVRKQRTDEGYTMQEYSSVISGINNARMNDKAAHVNPLWWGIVDLRAEKISPCPDLPRANQFLTNAKVNELLHLANGIIEEEKSRINSSCIALLEAISLSEIISLRTLSEESGTNGINGLCALLAKDNTSDIMRTQANDSEVSLLQEDDASLNRCIEETEEQEGAKIRKLLSKVKVNDTDTRYIGKCLQDVDIWIYKYGGFSQSERTVDMYLIGPCLKVPNVEYTYGENHSDADKDEKSSRSGCMRSGKACDFIFWSRDREVGVGENTGPKYKDCHDKAKTDFIDVIKVARAQHIRLQTMLVEESGFNPLPPVLQEALVHITIPFFQIVGMKMRFYLLLQVNGDVYAIFEWASQKLPRIDADIGITALLIKYCFVYRSLVNRVGRLLDMAMKKAVVFRESLKKEVPLETVKLEHLQTPTKPKQRRNSLEEDM